ncbi:hypothetical protein PHYSODRAFT_246684 [Phytophthora sojae]|uniref:Uncharacterized protein n=1 Tax=Phytophthora sojae (strain P6497) TaxID=1094619 RepID=G5ADU6_PHYSP|nr:hypothetical protein PHYSODRAFT_246684 [Phytophthora sojae]EGZ06348.1 hypothetical protein PHYSODRAFT_246684 [Phytophthora sojae]|eukprot:XP_009538245.1 hypothetical protein PHYSODRAFT_246684 [Phytophthora sojae]
MARLRRQHRRELRHGDRTQRKMRARKDAVARLDARLQASLCLQEQQEVSAVLRDLVGRVELSVEHATNQRAEEALAWSELQQSDQRDCAARLETEWGEAEDLIVVEQQLLAQRVEGLGTRLQAAQQHLRDEKEAGAELHASYAQLEQDVANKSGWLTALALSSMSLLQVEDSKHQSELSAENAQLRDKLQTAHKVAKKCKHKYKKVKAEVKALRGQLNVVKGNTTQANTHFTPNVLKPDHSHAGRLHTLRGTKNR